MISARIFRLIQPLHDSSLMSSALDKKRFERNTINSPKISLS